MKLTMRNPKLQGITGQLSDLTPTALREGYAAVHAEHSVLGTHPWAVL